MNVKYGCKLFYNENRHSLETNNDKGMARKMSIVSFSFYSAKE